MKFKQIDGQNQRIERISPTQLVVGIDMAKETHVAQATNFRGIVLAKRHLTFKNNVKVMKSYKPNGNGIIREEDKNKLPFFSERKRFPLDTELLQIL